MIFIGLPPGRGPEQLLGIEDGHRGDRHGGISEEGRALLKEAMKEGQGDHILMLRLFQVHEVRIVARRMSHASAAPYTYFAQDPSVLLVKYCLMLHHPRIALHQATCL